jgi:chromate transporter
VKQRRDNQKGIDEYNAFCQMLLGASSTQVLTLIGYKRGGVGTITAYLDFSCPFPDGEFLLVKYMDQQNILVISNCSPMAVGFRRLCSQQLKLCRTYDCCAIALLEYNCNVSFL